MSPTVFNILVHVGVVLTYPILISIGTLLSVPGNAGRVSLHVLSITSNLLIIASWVLWWKFKLLWNESKWPHLLCCGVVSRGQHWGPLRQTDYTASLSLSSWKPNHQCASTDPATIPSLREDQVAKATLNASRQVLFFNHDGLYEGQWVTPTCPRAPDRKNTRGWRGSLVLIISRICCTHPLQPQCPVVYLTLCN